MDGKAGDNSEKEETSGAAADDGVDNNQPQGSAFGNFGDEDPGEGSVGDPVEPVEDGPGLGKPRAHQFDAKGIPREDDGTRRSARQSRRPA